MADIRYTCNHCKSPDLIRSPESWQCNACGHTIPCNKGIPKFFCDTDLGQHDQRLLKKLYDGFYGRFYQLCAPMVTLPARPFRSSKLYWVIYAVMWLVFLSVLFSLYSFSTALLPGFNPAFYLVAPFIFVGLLAVFSPVIILYLILALPTKISLERNKYHSNPDFKEVHRELIDRLKQSESPLRILDVSTGTANSLIRHGWLDLNASYVGIDYSLTMLKQAWQHLQDLGVAVDLIQADAAAIPIEDGTFDIVLNYGVLNAYENTGSAFREMLRVCKEEGTILVFDEQLYPGASFVERLYFRWIISRHDIHCRFPINLLPKDQTSGVAVHQIYEFYYLAVIKKNPILTETSTR